MSAARVGARNDPPRSKAREWRSVLFLRRHATGRDGWEAGEQGDEARDSRCVGGVRNALARAPSVAGGYVNATSGTTRWREQLIWRAVQIASLGTVMVAPLAVVCLEVVAPLRCRAYREARVLRPLSSPLPPP